MIQSFTTNLMVEDILRSAHFYEQTLGFKIIDSVAYDHGILKFAILSDGSHTLMLEERTEMIREFPSLACDRVQGSISLFVKIHDFEHVVASLRKKDLVISEVRHTFYGTQEVTIVDPDGYALVLAGERHESR